MNGIQMIVMTVLVALTGIASVFAVRDIRRNG
jgi:Flp pilus assembly protein CpaB